MTTQNIGVNHLNSFTHPSNPSWVIIDSKIDDLEMLVSFASQSHQVFLLDETEDGVSQITQFLQSSHKAPSAIHLISHGAPGTLYLGNGELSLGNFASYVEQLKAWAVCDLFVYGCNVAAGDAGEEFIHKLHAATQANVVAANHLVGKHDLGGDWNLNFHVGNVQSSSFVTADLVAQYAGVFDQLTRIYTVTEDNANNSSDENNIDRTPDGDFGRGIRVGANGGRNTITDPDTILPIQPIEFYIDTDVDATVGNAFLFLSVFDVDANARNPEQNLVTFNGTQLGLLEGKNELAVKSVFRLDNSQISLGANYVQIDINIQNFSENWEAEIERAELLVNYIVGTTAPGGTASLDVIQTDDDNYSAGETIEFIADLDTSLPSQLLEVETILRDPNGNAVEFTDITNYQVTGNPPGIDSDTLIQNFTLPGDATPGVWSIDISVFDQTTQEFQLIGTQTFSVGTVSPSPVPSGPLVFQFDDFVLYEQLDDDRPYQGSSASFNDELYARPKAVSDETLYLLANPDVAEAVQNGVHTSGFEHYEQFGRAEGRNKLPLDYEIGGLKIASLFDETYYLGEYQDVANGLADGPFVYGYDHFVKFGIIEGRNPSLYYNEAFYLANNPDVVEGINLGRHVSGFDHYLNVGHLENRDPSEFFDADDYLTNNPDVVEGISLGRHQSGFDHYIEFGASEGRIRPSDGIATLLYEETFYLNTNADVAEAVQNGVYQRGFDHYISLGQSEGRDPSPFFDESAYLGENPDVAEAVLAGVHSSGMEHYFRAGRQEGRVAFEVGTEV